MPAVQEKSFTPTKPSQSIAGRGGGGGAEKCVAGGAKAIGGTGNATGGASCCGATLTFEEKSTVSGCNAVTGDDDDVAARAGTKSPPTSASSRTTRSRSHPASPRAANATRSARNGN